MTELEANLDNKQMELSQSRQSIELLEGQLRGAKEKLDFRNTSIHDMSTGETSMLQVIFCLRKYMTIYVAIVKNIL